MVLSQDFMQYYKLFEKHNSTSMHRNILIFLKIYYEQYDVKKDPCQNSIMKNKLYRKFAPLPSRIDLPEEVIYVLNNDDVSIENLNNATNAIVLWIKDELCY